MPFLPSSSPTYFSPPKPYYLRVVCFFLLAVLAWIVHLLMQDQVGFAPLYLLSLIQLSPIIICTARKKYNYIAFILFNHFFSYSTHKFNQLAITLRVNSIYPEALRAIDELTTCTLLMLAGYFSIRLLLPSRRSNEPYQLLSLKRWHLIVVSLYIILVPIFIDYLPSWYLVLHFTILGADMILLLSSNSPGHERLAAILKIAVFFSTILYFIHTGMLTLVGVLAAYIFIAACIRQKAVLFILPVILTIIGSAIQTVKAEYRRAILVNWGASTTERVMILGTLLQEKFSNDWDTPPLEEEETELDGTDKKLLSGFARIGDDSLERVLDWTPRKVPFWEGETYAHLPFILIPRVLWPDKPSRHLWQKFGRVYGYLGENDKVTSVGVTFLAEAYMNFGFPGLYTVAFFFGSFAWLVEAATCFLFKGNFAFTFMVFLIPLQWYAADLGTIVNSIGILLVTSLVFRNQILNMARNDIYSKVAPAY